MEGKSMRPRGRGQRTRQRGWGRQMAAGVEAGKGLCIRGHTLHANPLHPCTQPHLASAAPVHPAAPCVRCTREPSRTLRPLLRARA